MGKLIKEVDKLKHLLEYNPVIAAVKNEKGLNKALESDCEIIFLLYGDILNIKNITSLINKHNKKVFIHLDMITGFANNPIIIDYVCDNLQIEGVITTKVSIVKRALEKKINVIQRFFILDSMSLTSALESIKKVRPQAIEIMPGIIPKVISSMSKEINIPIIAGGLVEKKEEVFEILKSGAMAVSTSDAKIWE